MNHVHNTNKIIPKQRRHDALWTTRLDVYDPQDESTDCIGGVIGRLGEAMFPETILFCSSILDDVKHELQSELGREPGQEPMREPKREPELEPVPMRESEPVREPGQQPDPNPEAIAPEAVTRTKFGPAINHVGAEAINQMVQIKQMMCPGKIGSAAMIRTAIGPEATARKSWQRWARNYEPR